MSVAASSAYYLLWLAAGLVICALASAALSAHLRWRMLRQLRAEQALAALARYCLWVDAQRRQPAFFEGDCRDADSPLLELRQCVRETFDELALPMLDLAASHA